MIRKATTYCLQSLKLCIISVVCIWGFVSRDFADGLVMRIVILNRTKIWNVVARDTRAYENVTSEDLYTYFKS